MMFIPSTGIFVYEIESCRYLIDIYMIYDEISGSYAPVSSVELDCSKWWIRCLE